MIKTRILTILYTLCLLTQSGNIYAGDTDSEEMKAKVETESTAVNNPEDAVKKEEENAEENAMKTETEENSDDSENPSPKASEEDEEPDCD